MMRKLKMAAMKMVKATLAACFAKWRDFVANAIEVGQCRLTLSNPS
jgi:hypothetical protein